jgi:hypothetical protein
MVYFHHLQAPSPTYTSGNCSERRDEQGGHERFSVGYIREIKSIPVPLSLCCLIWVSIRPLYFVYAFHLLAAIAKEVKHGGFNRNEKFSVYILLYMYGIGYWSV